MEHVQLDCVLSDWLMEQGKEPIKAFLVFCRWAADGAMAQEPWYGWRHAGSVANKYGSTTTTAIWGVWSTPDQNIHVVVGRVTISGRSVPNPYYGGERAYRKWYWSHLEAAV